MANKARQYGNLDFAKFSTKLHTFIAQLKTLKNFSQLEGRLVKRLESAFFKALKRLPVTGFPKFENHLERPTNSKSVKQARLGRTRNWPTYSNTNLVASAKLVKISNLELQSLPTKSPPLFTREKPVNYWLKTNLNPVISNNLIRYISKFRNPSECGCLAAQTA